MATESVLNLSTAVISLVAALLAFWDSRTARREARNASVIAQEVRGQFNHLTEVVGLERACRACDAVLGYLREKKLRPAAQAAMELHEVLPRIPQVGLRRISQHTTAPTIDDAIHDICLRLQRDADIRKSDVEDREKYADIVLKIRRVLSARAGELQRQI